MTLSWFFKCTIIPPWFVPLSDMDRWYLQSTSEPSDWLILP